MIYVDRTCSAGLKTGSIKIYLLLKPGKDAVVLQINEKIVFKKILWHEVKYNPLTKQVIDEMLIITS